MIVKCILSPILFISLACFCHSQESVYIDILNVGDKILKKFVQGADFSDEAHYIWDNLPPPIPINMTNHIILTDILPGVLHEVVERDTVPLRCITDYRIKSTKERDVCIETSLLDVLVIREALFKCLDDTEELEPFDLEIGMILYNRISKSCQKPSTCLFHKIAMNYVSQVSHAFRNC